MSRPLIVVILTLALLIAGCIVPLEEDEAGHETRYAAAMEDYGAGFEPDGDINGLDTELRDGSGTLLATVETAIGLDLVLHARATAYGETFELYCHGDTVLVREGGAFVPVENAPFSCSEQMAQALFEDMEAPPAPHAFEDHTDGSFTAFIEMEVPEYGPMDIEVVIGPDDRVRSLSGMMDDFSMTFVVQYGEKRHIEMPQMG